MKLLSNIDDRCCNFFTASRCPVFRFRSGSHRRRTGLLDGQSQFRSRSGFPHCVWHTFCLCHTSRGVSHCVQSVSAPFIFITRNLAICRTQTTFFIRCRIYKAMNSSNILQPASQGSKQQNENRYIAVRMQSKYFS